VAGDLAYDETVTGFLAYERPSYTTVKRIVRHEPVFEWINEWTWLYVADTVDSTPGPLLFLLNLPTSPLIGIFR